jgi:hypothetical protein
MQSGIELLNRSQSLIRWELVKLKKEVRETNPKREPTMWQITKTVEANLRVLTVALNTMSIKQLPTEWKLSSEQRLQVDL